MLYAVIAMALLGLVFANMALNRVRPKTTAEINEEQMAEQEKRMRDAQQNAPKTDPLSGGNTTDLVALAPDAVLGPAKVKPTITIGYKWTPVVQASPSTIENVITAITKMAPDFGVRVVDTDVVAGVPEGVSTDGRVIVPLSGDGSIPSSAAPIILQEVTKLRTGAPAPAVSP